MGYDPSARAYVGGRTLVRVKKTTTSGKVNIAPAAGEDFSTVICRIQRKAGDAGKYSWCLADTFTDAAGGDILVYDETGANAPDGTKVNIFCESIAE